MFMRLVQLKGKPERVSEFQSYYQETVIPTLQNTPGCLFACLIQGESSKNEYISMTLWDTIEHVNTYAQGGGYQQLLDKSRPYLSDSAEWKIQLSESLTLEYMPVAVEPVTTSFSIATPVTDKMAMNGDSAPLHVRLVSLKIHPGKMEEYKKLYQAEVLPVLKKVSGCRYVYLSESMKASNEFVSITIWDSKKDADLYEASGQFDQLLSKLRHTFTELFQWKMELDKSNKSATSDDLKVDHYDVVTGKSFLQ